MRRILGTRLVWVSGLEAFNRHLKLPRVSMRLPQFINEDAGMYDIRRVRRAKRTQVLRFNDTHYRFTGKVTYF